MVAIVQTAPYIDRSARLICVDCDLEEDFERTAPAQEAAREHNRTAHAFPEIDLLETLDPTEPKDPR